MNFDAVFTIRKEFEKEEFLRQLLIELATKNDTPIDVVDATLGEVKESVKEVIVCTAHVQGNCTASIGYDRQESYVDYESYREKVGNTYVTRQRPVTKYRTVTDWQPFHTQYSGEATCAAYNSDEFTLFNHGMITAITTASNDSVIEEGEATVDSYGLSSVVALCKSQVQATVHFPGDRHKDAQYNSDLEIETLTCYKLPHYEVTYTYKDKKYTASCFACGAITIDTETPPNDINITTIVKQKTKGLEATKKIMWWLVAISLVAGAFLCFKMKFAWVWPLNIILLIFARNSNAKYNKEYIKCSDELSKDIANSKISALKAALKKHGFAPLGSGTTKALAGCSVPGAEEPKGFKGRVVLSWILTVIMVIASLITANNVRQEKLHSPKHVDIKVVEKTESYDPDASPYINGCYYIELEYELSSEKLGVDYIEVEFFVKDKDGKELGSITSSLSGINLEKGNKTTITTTLEENQPETNEFFVELYETDLSELEFSYEIQSIQFSDGKYYHNNDK